MPIRIHLNFCKNSTIKETNISNLAAGYFSFLAGIAISLFIPIASANSSRCAEHFPTASKIVKLGMSTALSGPIQYLGLAMSQGVQQKIAEANCDIFWRSQGIQFELTILDDSYNPEVAAANTKTLIDKHKAIAIIGNVGTPTAEKSWKIANDNRVIFYGAYTGSNMLRLIPPAPYVFNYRPSYDQEMEAIARDIVKQGVSINSIGVFLQNDAFGNSGLASLRNALKNICNNCRNSILQMRYERNSLKITTALKTFIAADIKPKVVILVAAITPTAEFIRFAQRIAPATRFYSLSFTGATSLRRKLYGSTSNLTLSQVVPDLQKLIDVQKNPDTNKNPELAKKTDSPKKVGSTQKLEYENKPNQFY